MNEEVHEIHEDMHTLFHIFMGAKTAAVNFHQLNKIMWMGSVGIEFQILQIIKQLSKVLGSCDLFNDSIVVVAVSQTR